MYKVAVIGADSIGTGLARRFANADLEVELVDSNENLDLAESMIKLNLKSEIEKGFISVDDAKNIVEKIIFLESIGEISSNLDLVIESISGNNIDRIKLFKKIDAICQDKTILVTTSLSINLISLTQATSRPDKILGMQFFSPSEVSQFTELARSKYTSDDTYSKISCLCRDLGLIVADVRNSPGYCLNRYFIPVINEAVRLLEIGAADINTINYAAKEALTATKGPFEVLNQLGTDTIYKKCNELFHTIGEFYRPTNLLKATAEGENKWDLVETSNEKDFLITTNEECLEIKKHFRSLVFKLVSIIAKENITTLNNIDLSAKIGLGWKVGPVESMNQLDPSLVNSYMDEISIIYPSLPIGNIYTNSSEWIVSSSLLEINNNVANILLNRPDNKNVLSVNLLKELQFDFDRIKNDSNIDFITISGPFNAFSSGEDLNLIHKLLCERDFDELKSYIDRGNKLLSTIKSINKPVVAILDGEVFGGGLSIALSCDYIFATKNTKLSFPEVNSGMIPLFGGITFLLERLDYLLAKYLLITGVELPSEEALAIGLIDNTFSNWHELNSKLLEVTSGKEDISKYIVKPDLEIEKANNILRNAKLFKDVDLLKQRKLISRRAKELIKIIDNKSSDALYGIDHLIERIKAFNQQESLEFELAKTQSYLQYTDILFYLSQTLNKKENRELINI